MGNLPPLNMARLKDLLNRGGGGIAFSSKKSPGPKVSQLAQGKKYDRKFFFSRVAVSSWRVWEGVLR